MGEVYSSNKKTKSIFNSKGNPKYQKKEKKERNLKKYMFIKARDRHEFVCNCSPTSNTQWSGKLLQ